MEKFEEASRLANVLKNDVKDCSIIRDLPFYQREAIDQILSQISRIVHGETFTPWLTIVEYARSAFEVKLAEGENEKEPEQPTAPAPPEPVQYFGDPPIPGPATGSCEAVSSTIPLTRYCMECSGKLPVHQTWCTQKEK